MKKKDKQEEELEETEEDMDKPKEKPNPAEYDEEDNMPKKKKADMDETKKLVQEAIKDMILEQVKDMRTVITEEVRAELSKDMKIANEVAMNEKSRRLQDMNDILLKDPYNFSEDFLKDKTLEKLEGMKEIFEQSKTYKDFVVTQEEAKKPNKEIFEDFSEAAKTPQAKMWDFVFTREVKS